MSKAFVLDIGRCTGCEACVVACANEHQLPPERAWREVLTYNGRRFPGLPVFHLSMACNHCVRPTCRDSCPAGVYSLDGKTGAILSDTSRCLGCHYCSWACPYDAPKFDHGDGAMRKCDFCVDRLRAGREPACVTTCPTGALEVEEREPLGPAVRFSGGPRSAPRQTSPAPFGTAVLDAPPKKITLRSEWALLVFTTVASILAAVAAASIVRPLRFGAGWFLLLGALGMTIAASHLGRPLRGWRAIWNWRRSWLSREVILFVAFLALGTGWLATQPRYPALGAAAALAGFATLFVIDRLYKVALHTSRWDFHSAHTLLTGAYLGSLLAGSLPAAMVAGALKLGLYLARKRRFRASGQAVHPWWSGLRLFCGFIAPPAAVLLGHSTVAAIAAVVGDLIDRAEFYAELDVVTPRLLLHRHACRYLGKVPVDSRQPGNYLV